jgi:hypothetical protein
MLKAIRQRVRIHDRYQLEIKIEYPLLPSKRTRYHLNTYLFIPHNLAINELSYSPNEFYRRLQNYIRFKTPELSLVELLEDPGSPLQMIDRIWQEPVAHHDTATVARLVEQFKFLRAIMRRTLNRLLQQHWRKFIAGHRSGGSLPDDRQIVAKAEQLLTKHLRLVQEIVTRFRSHAAKVAGDAVPERLRYSYRLTDEAISVVVEGNLITAMRLVTVFPPATVEAHFNPLLVPPLQAELDHRREQGYQSLLHKPDKRNKQNSRQNPHHEPIHQPGTPDLNNGNERYLHHLSLLKKYTSSVLYLATSLETEGETTEHLLFAIAAGVSMIFATVIAFYVQAIYGNFTSPLFVALVVGYMFKDRIKELGRSASTTLLRRYYYDRRVYIYTLDRKQRLGRVREKMVFLKEEEIPAQVKAAYQRSQLSPIDIDGYSEHVIRYSRNVRLIADAFRKVRHEGTPLTGLSDILRLDIRPFLHKMDNPSERRYYFDGETLRTIKLNRVYYINIVSTYSRAGEAELIISKNVRVTLNRKGLIRLEEV